MRGKLISFEGIDGCGKSTQCELLRRWLCRHRIPHVMTSEPGGTALGDQIRELLLYCNEYPPITALAEAFLFQADRAQHFATKIVPALASGNVVITDRCFDSSVAYQGVGRGLGIGLIEQISRLATNNVVPDCTLLLDIEPFLAHLRLDLRRIANGYDRENDDFYQRVREAYLYQARLEPERIKIIDASKSSQSIHHQVLRLVYPLFESLK